MKKLILFTIVFLCLQTVFAELPRVAVVEIKAADKGVKSDSLTKYLRSEFTQKGKNKYRFVSQEEYRKATLKMQGKTQDLVNNQKYRTEYGNLTSANLLLITEIDCDGNDCTIYSTLINIKGEDIDSTHEDFQKNTKQSAHDALSRIVAYLVKQSDSAADTADSGDNADGAFCRQAKKDAEKGDMDGWRIYKEKFPHGACTDEAEEALDKKGCEIAKQKNTVEAWQKYLEKHPNGKCVSQANNAMFAADYEKAKAESELKRLKERWSKCSDDIMSWNEAKNYCSNLTEGGYTDWRLPNIDELRTLIQNHSGTQTGGSCPISEKAGKLDDWTDDCKGRSGSNFSKLGDTGYFWSSSVRSVTPYHYNWVVDFGNGLVADRDVDSNYYVRCVR